MIEAEKITKLPKWAQEHIQALMRDADNARNALARWTDFQTETDIWIEEYVHDGSGKHTKKRYIAGRCVTFRLSDGTEVDATIRHDRTDALTINSGSRTVRVLGSSANQIYVGGEE